MFFYIQKISKFEAEYLMVYLNKHLNKPYIQLNSDMLWNHSNI